jgi:hypothetical protein
LIFWEQSVLSLVNTGRFFTTFLASSLTTIFSLIVFVKTIQRFDLFAMATSYCYAIFSHIRTFLRLWLEPIMGYVPVVGSFYNNTEGMNCNAILFDI